MIEGKKKYEDEEMTLADVVENEEDKKILAPVKPVKSNSPYIFGYITVDAAFMRKEPNEDSEVITILKKGEAVIVDPNGDAGDYSKITAQISVGYILKSQYILK